MQLSRDKGVPERVIVINREKAADQKLTISKISAFLETMMSGTSAGNLREDGNEYRILVKASDAEYMSLDHLLNLQVTNNIGKQVMLRNIAHIESKLGPTLIERRDQERILNVSANFENRGMGEIIKEVQENYTAYLCLRDLVSFLRETTKNSKKHMQNWLSASLWLYCLFT